MIRAISTWSICLLTLLINLHSITSWGKKTDVNMGNIFTELTPELVRLVGVHLNVFILVLVGHPRLFSPRSQLNGDGLTKVLLVHLEIFILTTKSLWPNHCGQIIVASGWVEVWGGFKQSSPERRAPAHLGRSPWSKSGSWSTLQDAKSNIVAFTRSYLYSIKIWTCGSLYFIF